MAGLTLTLTLGQAWPVGILLILRSRAPRAVCNRQGGLRVDVGGAGGKEVEEKRGNWRLRWAKAV